MQVDVPEAMKSSPWSKISVRITYGMFGRNEIPKSPVWKDSASTFFDSKLQAIYKLKQSKQATTRW
jgi:hypothetical protein